MKNQKPKPTPIVFIETPDAIRRFGPLTVEYDHYFGPSFWWSWLGRREVELTPGRWSVLWLVWRLVRKGMEGKRNV